MRNANARLRTRATVRHRAPTTRVVVPRPVLVHAPAPELPAVASPSPRDSRTVQRLGLAPRWWAVIAALTLSAFAVLALRLHVYDLGYEIARLRVENQALAREHDELTLKLSVLREPGRIAERSSRELGMRLPEPRQLRNVE